MLQLWGCCNLISLWKTSQESQPPVLVVNVAGPKKMMINRQKIVALQSVFREEHIGFDSTLDWWQIYMETIKKIIKSILPCISFLPKEELLMNLLVTLCWGSIGNVQNTSDSWSNLEDCQESVQTRTFDGKQRSSVNRSQSFMFHVCS